MAPPLKSVLWNQLKLAVSMGHQIPLDKPYVVYKEDELQALVDQYLGDAPATDPEATDVADSQPVSAPAPRNLVAPAAAQTRQPPAPIRPDQRDWNRYPAPQLAELLGVPLKDRGEDRAGLTFNTHGPDDPIRVDSNGRVWFQDEVAKPAIPKPRMRRIVRGFSRNVETVVRTNERGAVEESFEVAGSERRSMETKVTLPSWQTGIYKDPRLPFKIHVYNGARGFDWGEIVKHYNGIDLVPTTIKRLYVGQDLCFDIKTTRETLEREYRDRSLGRID